MVFLAADAEENLPDLDTSAGSVGPAVCLTHTLLEPIGTSARKHLVDPEHVEGVDADSEMEGLLSSVLWIKKEVGGHERSARTSDLNHPPGMMLLWIDRLTLVMYLLAATRAASSASDETCSFSHEAKWTQ